MYNTGIACFLTAIAPTCFTEFPDDQVMMIYPCYKRNVLVAFTDDEPRLRKIYEKMKQSLDHHFNCVTSCYTGEDQ